MEYNNYIHHENPAIESEVNGAILLGNLEKERIRLEAIKELNEKNELEGYERLKRKYQ